MVSVSVCMYIPRTTTNIGPLYLEPCITESDRENELESVTFWLYTDLLHDEEGLHCLDDITEQKH